MNRKIVFLVLVPVLLFSMVLGARPIERRVDVANSGDSELEVLSGSAESGGVDWWPMFHHDLNHTGYSTSEAPKTNATLWTYTTGSRVWSQPSVADGRVFVGSNGGKISALNATTGAYLWSYTTAGQYEDSSPAVVDGRVFVGSYNNNVYAFNASTGALVWSYATGGQVESSPAVVDGRVFVGSGDAHKLYCLNATTGAFIWSYLTGDWVVSSPAVVDGRVYVGSEDHKVYALNATTGELIWNYTTGNVVQWSSPAVADGKVFVGSGDCKVYALNATTGELIWRYTTGGQVWCSPSVADGRVYIGSDDGKVYAFGPLHDIAIANVLPSTSEAYSGQSVNITVAAKNEGTISETFDVSACYDSTLIGTQTVTDLPQDEEKTLTFSWDTTDVPGGHYTISANATIVPGETDTADNNFIDGTITVTSPVRITEVVPCNQTGYPKDTFKLGTLAFFRVTINSTALVPQNTLITVNLYDNASTVIGIASFQGSVLPGVSTNIFGLCIPSPAIIGTATIYADCYTDWPSQGGFPHCPEMSATLEITGP